MVKWFNKIVYHMQKMYNYIKSVTWIFKKLKQKISQIRSQKLAKENIKINKLK
uniref:Uncharacterized protein n=1 Tax=Anguilla anguilla TaxID=7936 RepID=A0A0E9UHM5_ANGAN